jgi:Ca2+-binding RTX toxin-like protein
MSNLPPEFSAQIYATAIARLQQFASQEDFLDQLQVAFGERFDGEVAIGIKNLLQEGDTSFLPAIEVRSNEELAGANGAYDNSRDRILLSEDFLHNYRDRPDFIVNLLLEEIGHKFDRLLNGDIDSAGDEGAIFAAIAQGQSLSPEALVQLRSEDDWRTLAIDGQQVVVEMESWTGTSGDDTYSGTAADDTLSGLEGNDTLNGLGGIDYLFGDDGNDTLNGGDGKNTLFGGAGSDTLNGGVGDDYLSGDDDNDTLDGGDGNDTLLGGNGNDKLTGSGGTDYLDGGAGDDDLGGIVPQISPNPQIADDGDTFIGGDGYDRAVLRAGSTGITINYTDPNNGTISGGGSIKEVEYVFFYGNNGNDTVNLSAATSRMDAGGGNDTLTAGNGDDILIGGAGDDTMSGGNGNDLYDVDSINDLVIESANGGTDTVNSSVTYTLTANVENLTLTGANNINGTGNGLDNTLFGNSANNNLSGGDGNDILDGKAGNDTLTGGAGDDFLYGSVGNDNLNGGDGNDNLNGGTGDDTLIGGKGDDIYDVDSLNDVITENANEGIDSVYASVSGYTLSNNVEWLRLYGNATSGNGNALDNALYGNILNDTLDGKDGNDYLNGGAGNDTLIGGKGNDIYDVDSLNDVITENANEGIDLVYASVSGYTLGANVEQLQLYGNANSGNGNALDNILYGNILNDTLDGKDGNDTLIGGAGNDTMIGGAGNDTYDVDSNGDIVTENANGGTDTVNASVTYTLGANVENLTLTGTNNINGAGNSLDNTLFGNSGNNSLSGGDGNDILDAKAGNDALSGGDGNDFLYGSVGDDTLDGGNGNDYLHGGTGDDTLIGGKGDDSYDVDSLGDIITEVANEGTDLVYASVSGYTLGDNLEWLQLTGNAIAGNGNALGNAIYGNNLNNTLNGGGGNDFLNGGLGNDTLIGGTGDDIYDVDSLGDIITENANEGNDLVYASISGYTLGANVEQLQLYGNANSGNGNALDNVLLGNILNDTLNGGAGNDTLLGGSGNDILIGSSGNDILTGGSGNDAFVFSNGTTTTLTALGVDTITDLTVGEDKIQLSKSIFSNLTTNTGILSVNEFSIVTSDLAAETSTAAIVYNSNNGKLFYNSDLNTTGFGTNGGQFAQLATGLTLTNNQLEVI